MNEDDIRPEDIMEMLERLIEIGLIQIVGYADDGEPLYRFTEELLAMDGFDAVNESITNDILFSLWNKGFIEMNPINEDGDWDIRLCDKSEDFNLAKKELDEDEFLLFVQIYQELKNEENVIE